MGNDFHWIWRINGIWTKHDQYLPGLCQGHSVPRHLQRGTSYLRMLISPEWVVLVKLYAMKALWLYRYKCRGEPQQADYSQ
jgi:hypothetical protein